MQNMSSSGLVIGGKILTKPIENSFKVINPYTGKVFAHAPECSRVEVDQAVKAARDAFPKWSKTKWSDRQKAIMKCANALMASKDSLSELLTKEQGKSVATAAQEIMGAYVWMKLASKYENPNHIVRENDKEIVEIQYRPLGVTCCIIPWNFPIILIHFKIAQALLAGCTIIIKPSEHTPLSALEIGKIYSQILPPGVINVISSENKDLGRWLVEHPGIDKISFTGSTETGKAIIKSAADHLKRVTLELGGNDPAIILKDCNPKKAARNMFQFAFQNSGQVCMAVKRIFVHESMFDEFCSEIAKVAEQASFGNGLDDDVQYGPMNNEMQYTKVRNMLIDALDHGAQIVYGKVPPPAREGQGYLFPPVILKNVSEGIKIVDEEQFGPVVPVLSYKTTEEAIERANRTHFGLGGSIWTDTDFQLANELAAQLDAGTTWVNNHGMVIDNLPFGGAKTSGVGHEGGKEGLVAFMQMHVIKKRKPKKAKL